jgi:predicted nucleotidyltransferase
MGKNADLTLGIERFLAQVDRDFPVRRLILFGSRARGTARRFSDVDLIIVSPRFSKLNSIERGARMYDYWDLDYPADFLCYTPAEFERLRTQPTLVRDAVEHGIELR